MLPLAGLHEVVEQASRHTAAKAGPRLCWHADRKKQTELYGLNVCFKNIAEAKRTKLS